MEMGKKYNVTFDASDSSLQKGWQKKSQIICRHITEHLLMRLFVIVLIVVDISIVIYVLVTNIKDDSFFDFLSLAISCVFVVELGMRLYGMGPSAFFRNWINIVDGVVVLVTFVFSLVNVLVGMLLEASLVAPARLFTRLPRVINVLTIISNKKNFLNSSRYITSQNKRRYRLDGFDIDLCYITERVMAMSFPSSGLAALYRNSISDVARFLNERHHSHYKVYNLCEERGYDSAPFKGQVERFMVKDHNVPRLQDMVRFAKSVRDWLALDERNVIAVHCKGGKGRTGTMICAHLIDSGLFGTAQLSLDYFGQRRTDLCKGRKFQGVETPSQSRYVRYFEEMSVCRDKKKVRVSLDKEEASGSRNKEESSGSRNREELSDSLKREEPSVSRDKKKVNGSREKEEASGSRDREEMGSMALKVLSISIRGIEGLGQTGCADLWLSIHGCSSACCDLKLLEVSLSESKLCTVTRVHECGSLRLDIALLECPPLLDDVKIRFCSPNRKLTRGYDDCLFFFWFHTAFIRDNRLQLSREQLDNPHKKSTWKTFPPDFGVEVLFGLV